MSGNSIIPTDQQHDEHYRDAATRHSARIGQLEIEYVMSDGRCVDILRVDVSEDLAEHGASEVAYETIEAVLGVVGQSFESFMEAVHSNEA